MTPLRRAVFNLPVCLGTHCLQSSGCTSDIQLPLHNHWPNAWRGLAGKVNSFPCPRYTPAKCHHFLKIQNNCSSSRVGTKASLPHGEVTPSCPSTHKDKPDGIHWQMKSDLVWKWSRQWSHRLMGPNQKRNTPGQALALKLLGWKGNHSKDWSLLEMVLSS